MKSDVASVFLRASDFAVEGVYAFGNSTKTIIVVFEENYAGQDFYGVEVANSSPAAICQTSEIENDDSEVPGENEDAATLEIAGVTYNVKKAARAGDTTLFILSRD